MERSIYLSTFGDEEMFVKNITCIRTGRRFRRVFLVSDHRPLRSCAFAGKLSVRPESPENPGCAQIGERSDAIRKQSFCH
jgi:hypothetical protein